MSAEEQAQFHSTFFDEAGDHLRTLEARLLELEANPTDAELLNALFRAAHSVKGASSMLGFETLAALTHAMESVLEALRAYRLQSSPLIASTLLDATDMLAKCLEAASTNGADPEIQPLVARLESLAGRSGGAKTTSTPASPATLSSRSVLVTFRPPREVFAFGFGPRALRSRTVRLGHQQHRHRPLGRPSAF